MKKTILLLKLALGSSTISFSQEKDQAKEYLQKAIDKGIQIAPQLEKELF